MKMVRRDEATWCKLLYMCSVYSGVSCLVSGVQVIQLDQVQWMMSVLGKSDERQQLMILSRAQKFEKSGLIFTTQRQAKPKTKYQKKRLSYGHSDNQIKTILAEGWGSS